MTDFTFLSLGFFMFGIMFLCMVKFKNTFWALCTIYSAMLITLYCGNLIINILVM